MAEKGNAGTEQMVAQGGEGSPGTKPKTCSVCGGIRGEGATCAQCGSK